MIKLRFGMSSCGFQELRDEDIKKLISKNDKLRVCFDTNHLLGHPIKAGHFEFDNTLCFCYNVMKILKRLTRTTDNERE